MRNRLRDILARTPAAALLTLAATATGCEYFRDTAEQELANQRWRPAVAGK